MFTYISRCLFDNVILKFVLSTSIPYYHVQRQYMKIFQKLIVSQKVGRKIFLMLTYSASWNPAGSTSLLILLLWLNAVRLANWHLINTVCVLYTKFSSSSVTPSREDAMLLLLLFTDSTSVFSSTTTSNRL